MPDWVYTILTPSLITGWFLMLALLSYAEMEFEHLKVMGAVRTRVRMQRVSSVIIDLQPKVLERFRRSEPGAPETD
mgnify:CR=1 FL=1